jgi:hypothetical protein
MERSSPADTREVWRRLFDAIGREYRARLLKARDRARAELTELDRRRLEALAADGRAVAGSLDEDGARSTVRLNDDRARYSNQAGELRREATLIAKRARRTVLPWRRRQLRADAAHRVAKAEEHARVANNAHEQLRELGHDGRHLYPWFERCENALAWGLAAEYELDIIYGAAYHVLGAPSIAALTARCLISGRGIDRDRLEKLVGEEGDPRQQLLFDVAARLSDGRRDSLLTDALGELDGEDLERVFEAIAAVRNRKLTIDGSRADLWIRASEGEP